MPNLFKNYLVQTGGAVALWAALSTPFVVGGAALSVDAARLYNMDGDLQAASDALARAGAAELDQRSDSITRATMAVENLLKLEQKFAKRGAGDVEVDTIRFLKDLPSNDYEAIPTNLITYTPSEAKYIEVKVKPETVNTLFPTSVVSKITSTTLSSKSVAGLDEVVCGTAPVYICNPFEDTEQNIYTALEDPDFRRRQIQFKGPKGNDTSMLPGSFGWLDPFGGNSGASKLADAIAIDIPPTCLSKQNGVVTRSGNISSMRHGLNTRFDIYAGSFKKKSSDPRYAPAANVTKGYVTGKKACSASPSSEAMGLPRDNCFIDGTCENSHNSMGDGDWDFVEYMRVNHGGIQKLTIKDVTYKINYNKGTFTPGTPPSRYDMYRWEIDTNCVPGKLTYGNKATTPEEGIPTCHSSGPSTTVEDRRIIHAAVLNCGRIADAIGNGSLDANGTLPVETFVKVFVTEPMDVGNRAVIWGEMVGLVVEGDDAEANDRVALAR